jgi:chromosome segregation ATPase
MSDVMTANEARQILDVLNAVQSDLKSVKSDVQSLAVEMKVNQAKNDEQFKTLRAEVKAEINELRAEVKGEIAELRAEVKGEIATVRAEIKAVNDSISDLKTQQRSTDARLWAFVVGLVTLVGGGVIKVLWLFDRG